MENKKKFALRVNKIVKEFEEKIVLNEVSFNLYFGEKVGLVGANGSGKSTLAKIISGKLEKDAGDIEIFKNFKISYLPQELNQDILVQEYLDKEKMKGSDIKELFVLLEEYEFGEEILLRKISSLSGGEKTKIFLIKISLEKAEIIILDEPTNNLDIAGLEKLEEIIKKSKSAFLVISHDRKFLDNTVTKIIELGENHKIKIWDGNYSSFLDQKQNWIKRQEELFTVNQKEKKKLLLEKERQVAKSSRKMSLNKIKTDKNKTAARKRIDAVQRSAGKNLKRAEEKLDKFEEKEKIKYKRPLIIDFSEMKKSGNKVLEVNNLILKFGSKKEISFEVFSGDRVLISGKNGAGKTTLIKEILKKDNEKIIWGTNVVIGYLPQDLNLSKKESDVSTWFQNETAVNITESRKILKRFGFEDFEVRNRLMELSPGMRARLKIATMLANNPNLLILDEPTNNLDIEVLDELEKALEKYQGTIIFVSHDRYFIEKMKPNKIINL